MKKILLIAAVSIGLFVFSCNSNDGGGTIADPSSSSSEPIVCEEVVCEDTDTECAPVECPAPVDSVPADSTAAE